MSQIEPWSDRDAVRSTIEDNVRRGKPNGGIRPFGFRRIKADRDRGVEAALVVDEAEAAEIRDACRRVLAGEPLRSIVRDWRERVPTVTGGRWNNANVKRAITAPRVAKLREWNGEVVGDASWPAIVDRETWEQVRAVLDAPGRGPSGPAPRKHVLRGLAHCGRCDARLITRQIAGSDASNYVCPSRQTAGAAGSAAHRLRRRRGPRPRHRASRRPRARRRARGRDRLERHGTHHRSAAGPIAPSSTG
jgi:hypothetical protein